jgi:hypothetical protein
VSSDGRFMEKRRTKVKWVDEINNNFEEKVLECFSKVKFVKRSSKTKMRENMKVLNRTLFIKIQERTESHNPELLNLITQSQGKLSTKKNGLFRSR